MGDNQRVQNRSEGRRRGGFLKAVCLALVCVLLSGAATYGVLEYRIQKGDFTVPAANQVVLGSDGGTSANKDNGSLAPVAATGDDMSALDIYDMACSQVVGIKTEVSNPMGGALYGSSGMTTVTGSGFIISGDGYILTNYHVIETAYKGGNALKVVLNDGSEHDAKIIGFEESYDVAVIKIEGSGLNAVSLGDSDVMRVGESIYAVGNPLGELVYTMTEGIISALDRVISVDNSNKMNMFQISAAVNSGNSGGPVYDTKGRVVGIVTAKFQSSNIEGIGFAIPINDAIGIASQLIENGYVSGKAYLGITPADVSKTVAEYYSWVEGVYVKGIEPGSCSEKAGIKVGDIIIKFGDIEVASSEALKYAKKSFKAGDDTTITVWRSGEELVLPITLDEEPANLS